MSVFASGSTAFRFELMSVDSLHIIADKHRHGNFRAKHSEVEVNHEASGFSSRHAVWRIHCRNFHNRRLKSVDFQLFQMHSDNYCKA